MRVEGKGENREDASNIEFESIMSGRGYESWIRRRRTLNVNPFDDVPTSRAQGGAADKARRYTSSFFTSTASKKFDELIDQ